MKSCERLTDSYVCASSKQLILLESSCAALGHPVRASDRPRLSWPVSTRAAPPKYSPTRCRGAHIRQRVCTDAPPASQSGSLNCWTGMLASKALTFGAHHCCVRVAARPQSEFWAFSADQMALVDLPATIDYILQATAFDQVRHEESIV
eukprot:366328-Chlamydomonas_euryale.AAC.3